MLKIRSMMKIIRPRPRAICFFITCIITGCLMLKVFHHAYLISLEDQLVKYELKKENHVAGTPKYPLAYEDFDQQSGFQASNEFGSPEKAKMASPSENALESEPWTHWTSSEPSGFYTPLQPVEKITPSSQESYQMPAPNTVESGYSTQESTESYGVIPRPDYPLEKKPFIPKRRIVHLDLKGAPPKVEYFQQFFQMISQLGATGLLIEWEDTFPYKGILEDCKSGNAYSEDDVRLIFQWAKENHLEVIPLVQTFGHLEWVLKYEKFAHLREVERYAQVICLSNPEAIDLVKTIIDQVLSFHQQHENGTFFHMGADEAFQVGMCQKCRNAIHQKYKDTRDLLMLDHIKNIAEYVQEKYGRRVLMWHDMLDHVHLQFLNQTEIGDYVEPVVWAYAEDVNAYVRREMWEKFSKSFPYIWAASAFKGADGPDRYHSNIEHYMKNHQTWAKAMTDQSTKFDEFRGIILTGWQRFDHFAILCELLPVGIPSLAVNLQVVMNGGQWDQKAKNDTKAILGCKFEIDVYPQGYGARMCQFPGFTAYQMIQRLRTAETRTKESIFGDYMIRGWLSNFNMGHNYSSAWYTDKIVQKISMSLREYAFITKQLRVELEKIFHLDTVDEFILTYVDSMVEKLIAMNDSATELGMMRTFPKRPIPIKVNRDWYDKLVVPIPGVVRDDSRMVKAPGVPVVTPVVVTYSGAKDKSQKLDVPAAAVVPPGRDKDGNPKSDAAEVNNDSPKADAAEVL